MLNTHSDILQTQTTQKSNASENTKGPEIIHRMSGIYTNKFPRLGSLRQTGHWVYSCTILADRPCWGVAEKKQLLKQAK